VALGGPAGLTTALNEKRRVLLSREAEAQTLADRLPALLIEAMRIAMTIAHGIHGRRRAGPGETFWQFRQYENADAATLIDWRRSASSDQLYVREREWEAAHTFWLWTDLSASMNFQSHLSAFSKRDRALVLLLAVAELLVRSGERVGLLGLSKAISSRNATSRLAELIATNENTPILTSSLPPAAQLSRFSGVIMVSDFLDPPADIITRIEALSADGVSGHLIQVLDPAEETLPYEGRAEFYSPESDQRWVADHVDSLREDYIARLAQHKASISEHLQRIGWSHSAHHTDRSAAEPLLQLIMRLQTADAGGQR